MAVQHDERLIPLTEAATISPGRPHTSCVWRWCRQGIKARSGKRIRLDHVRVGGRIFTSAQALDRFFSAVAQADAKHFDSPASPRTRLTPRAPRQRARAIEQGRCAGECSRGLNGIRRLLSVPGGGFHRDSSRRASNEARRTGAPQAQGSRPEA